MWPTPRRRSRRHGRRSRAGGADSSGHLRLALLLGIEPAALVQELSEPLPCPPRRRRCRWVCPRNCLRRRPDIRRAEAQSHAATAQIGVATADLYPRFSLTGTSGSALPTRMPWARGQPELVRRPQRDLGHLQRRPGAVEYQGAGGTARPVFLAYQKDRADGPARCRSCPDRLRQEQERRRFWARPSPPTGAPVDLAQRLYSQGQTDFLNVLNASARSCWPKRRTLSSQSVATNLVSLYKALGGGWEGAIPTTAPSGAK